MNHRPLRVSPSRPFRGKALALLGSRRRGRRAVLSAYRALTDARPRRRMYITICTGHQRSSSDQGGLREHSFANMDTAAVLPALLVCLLALHPALCRVLPTMIPTDEEDSSEVIFASAESTRGPSGAANRVEAPVLEQLEPAKQRIAHHPRQDNSQSGTVEAPGLRRQRRNTGIVSRPLFASRERDARRLARKAYWCRYWASERRRAQWKKLGAHKAAD